MRRTHLLALLLALPTLGCAAIDKSYRDFTPEPPPALSPAPPSPEADALVARFYGKEGVDARTIADALTRAPRHAGLREIAAYDALARADGRAAFAHFLAAAADQDAIVPELYLGEMRALARTTSQHLQAQALLRELMAGHPRAAIRHLAAFDLARELRAEAEYEEAAQLVRELGFIDAWQVIGAFDNDQGKGLQASFPPEQDLDTTHAHPGLRVPVRFRTIAAGKLDGALPLGDVIWPAEAAVAYALAFVTVDRERQVDLRLTTTNAVRVWVDGKLAATDDKIYREELDNVVVRITLPAGETRLLVKSAHEHGPFRLAARVTELDGSIPADLRYSPTATATAAATPPAALPAASAQLVSPTSAVDKLADRNRRRFLQARIWGREGHAKRASYFLGPLLAETPDNPVVIFFAAEALMANDEAGKALDLWTRGAAKHPDAAGLLVERARFYAKRKLWDQAEKDLSAVVAKVPDARDAMMDRAAIYGRREWIIDRCLELDGVVSRWPDDLQAIGELARCKLERGYAEEGERLLRRASALAPGEPHFLRGLYEVAERRVDHAAAEARIRDLAAARPGAPEVSLLEADLDRRRGKVAEARQALEQARDLSPDAPFAYDRLAQLAHEARDRAGAERWWRLALERDPENAAVAQRLAALAPEALPLGDRLAPGVEEIERAVRAAGKVTVHPGSHTVVLLDDDVTAVHPDGSSKRIHTQVIKAVTTDGRDALIQAILPARGRVNVIEAYAVRKGGERQDAASITGGVVRFRGLDVGSVTVVQYAHFAPAPRFLPNEFAAERHLQAVNAQVEEARWRLVLPRDRALNVETRGQVARKEEVVGDERVVTFSVKGAPPLVPEPNMNPYGDELWTAAVSTLKTWDGYARWESALLAEAFSASPEIDALARKLTAGARTPREKVDKLWAHVAQEIRYQQDYEDTIAGVKPHSASQVVERGYGDCKDKAVLLIRLARAVGVELRFAVLRTVGAGKGWQTLPNQQFNHAIAYAPKQAGIDEPFFIDTTPNGLDIGNLPTEDEGSWSLVLDGAGRWEIRPIPYQSADLELIRQDIKVDLADPQKATAHDHIEARGGTASGIRAALRNAEGAKRYYQRLSDQIFPGTTLLDGRSEHGQDLTTPVSLRLDIDVHNAVRPEDEALRFEVPLPFPPAHAAALATRSHPLRLWRGVQEIAMDLDLGKDQQATHVPPDFRVEHPCFTLSRKAETRTEPRGGGTRIVVRSSYRNTCAEIAPADYPAFRAAVQKAVARSQDTLVFGPIRAQAAKRKK